MFTLEKTCDYAPIVADGVLRGSASACRKTKRAANATHAMWSEYWYGGSSHPDFEEAAREQSGHKVAPSNQSSENASSLTDGDEIDDDDWTVRCDEVKTPEQEDKQDEEDSSDDVQMITIASQ